MNYIECKIKESHNKRIIIKKCFDSVTSEIFFVITKDKKDKIYLSINEYNELFIENKLI